VREFITRRGAYDKHDTGPTNGFFRIVARFIEIVNRLTTLLGRELEPSLAPTNIPRAITVTDAFSPKFSLTPPLTNLLHIHDRADFYNVLAKQSLNDTRK
jgi:hypothetical protein